MTCLSFCVWMSFIFFFLVNGSEAYYDDYFDGFFESNLLELQLAEQSEATCQGDIMELDCLKQKIKIVSAVWEPVTTDKTICGGIAGTAGDASCQSADRTQWAVRRCDGLRACTLPAFTEDSGCRPHLLKVTYKCTVDEFSSTTSCKHKHMTLRCPSGSRLAIYVAEYGVSPTTKCAQVPLALTRSCRSTEEVSLYVARKCASRHQCTFNITDKKFPSDCPPKIKSTLSVTTACVLEHTIRSRKEIRELIPRHGSVTRYVADEAEVQPSANELEVYPKQAPSNLKRDDATLAADSQCWTNGTHTLCDDGFISSWMSLWQFFKFNHEKAVLYTMLCVCVGVILVLLILVCRLSCCPAKPKRYQPVVVASATEADAAHVNASTQSNDENQLNVTPPARAYSATFHNIRPSSPPIHTSRPEHNAFASTDPYTVAPPGLNGLPPPRADINGLPVATASDAPDVASNLGAANSRASLTEPDALTAVLNSLQAPTGYTPAYTSGYQPAYTSVYQRSLTSRPQTTNTFTDTYVPPVSHAPTQYPAPPRYAYDPPDTRAYDPEVPRSRGAPSPLDRSLQGSDDVFMPPVRRYIPPVVPPPPSRSASLHRASLQPLTHPTSHPSAAQPALTNFYTSRYR